MVTWINIKNTDKLVARETSVGYNSPSRDFAQPDDLNPSNYVTPGFKPFNVSQITIVKRLHSTKLSLESKPFIICVRQNAYYLRRVSFPRVLIADARSFQALVAILDYVTRLASMSCWYRSDARQDEFRPSQAALL